MIKNAKRKCDMFCNRSRNKIKNDGYKAQLPIRKMGSRHLLEEETNIRRTKHS